MQLDATGQDSNDIEIREMPVESADVSAWEEIEPGRYMPRRIRGSFLGRELG